MIFKFEQSSARTSKNLICCCCPFQEVIILKAPNSYVEYDVSLFLKRSIRPPGIDYLKRPPARGPVKNWVRPPEDR